MLELEATADVELTRFNGIQRWNPLEPILHLSLSRQPGESSQNKVFSPRH